MDLKACLIPPTFQMYVLSLWRCLMGSEQCDHTSWPPMAVWLVKGQCASTPYQEARYNLASIIIVRTCDRTSEPVQLWHYTPTLCYHSNLPRLFQLNLSKPPRTCLTLLHVKTVTPTVSTKIQTLDFTKGMNLWLVLCYIFSLKHVMPVFLLLPPNGLSSMQFQQNG